MFPALPPSPPHIPVPVPSIPSLGLCSSFRKTIVVRDGLPEIILLHKVWVASVDCRRLPVHNYASYHHFPSTVSFGSTLSALFREAPELVIFARSHFVTVSTAAGFRASFPSMVHTRMTKPCLYWTQVVYLSIYVCIVITYS